VAGHFAKAAEDAVAASGRFVVALSGGSTPQKMYQLLATEFAAKVPWRQTHVLFVDERCVLPEDAQSNFGAACRLLLDHVDVDYQKVHRMAGERDPETAAQDYDRLLQEQFGSGVDLLLLGMGEDGHTASLFPETQALQEQQRLCVANYVPKFASWRLTMTAPYINRAFEVAAMVSGASKAAMVGEALAGMGAAARLPIQLVQPASGRFLWMMDAAAAGMDDADAVEDAGSDIGEDVSG
jgi:6-phosphogluconolactonase